MKQLLVITSAILLAEAIKSLVRINAEMNALNRMGLYGTRKPTPAS